MIKKKICMLGSFAVGKTSLVQRFVKSIFSEKYHTTLGVKIDQKWINLGKENVNLILWDIHGEDEFQKVKASYLRGSSGFFLVIDGTRKNTVDVAGQLRKLVEETVGDIPFIVLINKSDLTEEWEIDDQQMTEMESNGWNIIKTSAKTGEGVEEAFLDLSRRMMGS